MHPQKGMSKAVGSPPKGIKSYTAHSGLEVRLILLYNLLKV
jgi:hypothetical protein